MNRPIKSTDLASARVAAAKAEITAAHANRLHDARAKIVLARRRLQLDELADACLEIVDHLLETKA